MYTSDSIQTCCFSGHRAAKLPWGYNESDGCCTALKRRIRDVLDSLYDSGARHFICGMALGCDMYFAEAVLALRAERGGVTLEAAVPCLDQDRFWPERAQARYRRLLSMCDTRTVLEHSYSPGCMERRNRYMVDRSSVLVAVYNGGSGGTLNTIRYARSRGLTVLQLTY